MIMVLVHDDDDDDGKSNVMKKLNDYSPTFI